MEWMHHCEDPVVWRWLLELGHTECIQPHCNIHVVFLAWLLHIICDWGSCGTGGIGKSVVCSQLHAEVSLRKTLNPKVLPMAAHWRVSVYVNGYALRNRGSLWRGSAVSLPMNRSAPCMASVYECVCGSGLMRQVLTRLENRYINLHIPWPCDFLLTSICVFIEVWVAMCACVSLFVCDWPCRCLAFPSSCGQSIRQCDYSDGPPV